MILNLLEPGGTPIDQQRFTWKEMVGEPISKLDDDAFTRVRVVLMNGIEQEALRFSHMMARMSPPALREVLAQVRRTEHMQTVTINWLLGPDHSPLETTIAYEESGTVGSVPVPGTVTGVLKTGMQKLMGRAPEAFVDKLGERLAFERTGVRLYEALIVKCQALQGTQNELPLMDLRKYRDDEARHFKLVERALEKLGADPTAQTPSADMAATASMGVLQVISDPRSTIPQALNALLTAELTDIAGWELLIKLAREHGEDDMANDFEQALQSETLHAGEVKRWLEIQVLEPV